MLRVILLTSLMALLSLSTLITAQDRAKEIRSSEYQVATEAQANPIYRPQGAIKWEETFADGTIPAGWQTIDNDGSGAGLAMSTGVNFLSGDSVRGQIGDGFWYGNFNGANSGGLIDEWIISPRLPLIESGDSLHFYAGAIGGNFDDSLKVLISTTDSLPGSFTDEIAYFKVDGPVGSWNKYSFDMSAYDGQEVYVAVNYYIVDGGPLGTHSDNVWIDHFILEGASTTARLQVVHNAADPAAASVDVYLNGALLLDDFAFRAATPFIDAPAGTPLDIGIAAGTSTSVDDTLANFNVTLTGGETYVAVANGVLDPSGFAANPDGRSTAFGLFINAMGREAAETTGNIEFAVLHGSTDAPTVDATARDVATLVDDAAYGDFTDYISVPAADYLLDITDATGTVAVGTWNAALAGLADSAAVVFASGFLDPAANQSGEAFGFYAALPNGAVVELPAITTARLQVIHNAADPAAASVDVYLNDGLLLDDFAFRAATGYIDAPAGSEINVGVAGGGSSSAADTLANFALTLTPGETYIAVANGVLDPSGFAANPDGRSTAFGLFINAMGREAAETTGNIEFAVLHGATDAPTVDATARGVATLVDDAAYGDFTDYISVPAADYLLDITDATGTVAVGTWNAALAGLADSAAVVFASGFLDPAANQSGEAFGFYAALPNGAVVELPAITTARLQVIHNAADPAAASVDIYLNDGLLLDDFAFRAATGYIDAPAGSEINVGVAGGGSSSAADTLANFALTLTPGETYIAVANGVLDPSGFAANPDGRSTAFGLFINAMGREAADSTGNVDFAVLHGATDAPTVDATARGVATLVDDAAYGDFTDYITVPAADYLLDITDGSGTVAVGTWNATLAGLADSAAVVFASGFLDPAANQDGEAFGFYAALPNGAVVELPAITTARLQVIHNAADPAAASVDIYLNDALLLDDFAFRAATPFIDAPAGSVINVGVAGGTSSSAADTLANFALTLTPGETYVAVANGVLDPSAFAANPDGRSTAFTILIDDDAREEAATAGNVEFSVLHGSTDAPTVDVVARDVATLVEDAAYTDYTDYISVGAIDYTIDITDASGTTTVAAFSAPLSGFADSALVVFASGFFDPATNQNGEAFGLYAALPNGDVIALPSVPTSIESIPNGGIISDYVLNQNYPNPFNPSTTITYALPVSGEVNITIFNILGQEVTTLVNERQEAGSYRVTFDAADLTTGIYFYTISAGDFVSTKRMILAR